MKYSDNTRGLAWDVYRSDKKRETSKGKVVNALIANGNTPTNYQQLCRLTGLTINVITRAIFDLRDEGILSHIVKVNPLSGNKARHYFLTEDGKQIELFQTKERGASN